MGRRPTAGVIADQTGALYGTTANQGANGQGMVFKLTPPSVSGGSWTESIVWTFTGVADGGGPTAGLLMDAAGVIYGSTGAGGSFGCGTFFQLLPPATSGGAWTENTLTNFPCGPNGLASSPGDFVRDQTTGTIYGTVQQAGQLNGGWIYRLTPPAAGGTWTYSVINNFSNNPAEPAYARGCTPWSLVLGPNGSLYGTTIYCGQGGGVVYQLSPPRAGGSAWHETVLYTFGASASSPKGNSPYGLVMGSKGVLYGGTALGGSAGNGTIYSLTPPSVPGGAWTETILHNFAATNDGNLPIAGVVLGPGDILYGTTPGGGSSETRCGFYNGCGTIFQLTPSSGGVWTETVLQDFVSSGGDAINPNPGRLLLRSGTLYGASYQGGASNLGAVYAVHP